MTPKSFAHVSCIQILHSYTATSLPVLTHRQPYICDHRIHMVYCHLFLSLLFLIPLRLGNFFTCEVMTCVFVYQSTLQLQLFFRNFFGLDLQASRSLNDCLHGELVRIVA